MSRLDWRGAMARQARSDFETLQLLSKAPGVPVCHRLHYLQMATEKLAKAFMTPPGDRPRATHAAFGKFLEASKGMRPLRAHLGFRDQHNAYKTYVDALMPAADAVESLHPEGSMNRINAEYPWEETTDGAARLRVPCEHDFAQFDPKRSEPMRKLMHFVHRCFDYLAE